MNTLVATLVALDPAIQAFIVAVITFAVTWALVQIALRWPFLASYLGPYRDQVITGVSAYIVAWVTNELNLIPVQYTDLINAVQSVIVAVLALVVLPFVTFKYFQRKGKKSFRLTS